MTTTETKSDLQDIEEFRAYARDWLAKNAPKRGTPEGEEAGRPTGEMGSEEEKRGIERCKTFQKKLAQAKHSRILVSSRLYPTELETS